MQDQNTDTGSAPQNEEQDIDNTNASTETENEPSTTDENPGEASSSQQTGELPDDFKGRLAREKKRSEREAAQLRGQISQLQQTVQALLPTGHNGVPPAQDAGGTGNAEDDIQRRVQSEIQRLMEKAQQEKTISEINSKVASVYQQMETADEIYPDFDDLRNDPTLVFPKPLLDQVAISSKTPIDVIYHLLKNRDELNRIASLHPALQSGEIALLSASFLTNRAQKGKEATKAPPPSNALSTNPAANSGRIRENATVDELRKLFR